LRSGASSSPSPGGLVELVLGNIRLRVDVLASGSPAAGAGAYIGISGVAAATASIAHIRAVRSTGGCLRGWRHPRSWAPSQAGFISDAPP
jgi:hypothetical protein